MSGGDAWQQLQAIKSKRDFRRKRLEERKKELEDIIKTGHLIKNETKSEIVTQSSVGASVVDVSNVASSSGSVLGTVQTGITTPCPASADLNVSSYVVKKEENTGEGSCGGDDWGGLLEDDILHLLSDVALHLPLDSRQLLLTVNKTLSSIAQHNQIMNLLEKFAVQLLIIIEEKPCEDGTFLEIMSVDHGKISAMLTAGSRKRKAEEDSSEDLQRDSTPLALMATANVEKGKENDVLSLLSMASTRERENKRIGEEILELLSRPSAKEKTLAERFRSQGGNVVKEFCPHGTKSECRRVSTNSKPCGKLHFRKIIQSHTDESLGDCSFLNTCFHMESCKYVHYEVDSVVIGDKSILGTGNGGSTNIVQKDNLEIATITPGGNSNNGLDVGVVESKTVLFTPQWVYCDLRYFDMTVLGKFSVIMADPPWDIHMELPYGTLSDDEMRQLNIPALQDEGLIFLWVTGRAMELGRECLELWGYERVDELIWVKTNQLQRIIRTGRTGHWLNHGKEHCLVGMKGNPVMNRGLDCDVIVAEVRATSHKPDEIYGIIERLSPGTRKIELFGRPHNIQPNWITLGNQLEGSHIVDDDVRKRFLARYPDGNCGVVKSK